MSADRSEPRTKLLFLFLDGVGLGSDDPAVNPFAAARTPFAEQLLGGNLTASLEERSEAKRVFRRLDARLGYDGLPQSATGQATLLTGANGAAIMAGHYGPWPGPTLKRALDRGSLFSQVKAAGGQAQLANLYPPGYFRAVAAGRQRENVPVYAAKAAGLRLKTLEDYRQGAAVGVDLSGNYVRKLDASLPQFSPRELGRRLAAVARHADFTFFDFWPTDSTGHRATFGEAVALIEDLDAFLEGVVENLGNVTLLLTSDHGNLEDKTTRSHTLALVPLLVLGAQAPVFDRASSLLDVAPGVCGALGLMALARPAVEAG